MRIEKRVQKDWNSIQSRANTMFVYHSHKIGEMIETAEDDILSSIAAVLEVCEFRLECAGMLSRRSEVLR